MKYCSKCGNTMDDNMNFCNACGAPANNAEAARANEQRCLDRLSTGLKHERLCYKIYGIVMIVMAAIFIVCGIVSMITGAYLTAADATTYEFDPYSYSYEINGNEIEITDGDVALLAGVSVIAFSAVYIICGLVLLAVAIVNLVMSGKLGKYRQNLYTDCTAGAKHASSVGSIVLAAFFNEIALIFVIINFVFMKKNEATFEAIKANQKLN